MSLFNKSKVEKAKVVVKVKDKIEAGVVQPKSEKAKVEVSKEIIKKNTETDYKGRQLCEKCQKTMIHTGGGPSGKDWECECGFKLCKM